MLKIPLFRGSNIESDATEAGRMVKDKLSGIQFRDAAVFYDGVKQFDLEVSVEEPEAEEAE